jgi:dUTP pyrophosphatase
MKIKIKRLDEKAQIPEYQTEGSAGFDFHSLDTMKIPKGQTRLIRTGLGFEIPEGYQLQVVPRSGYSLKTPMRVSNSPGCVDSDYRGEVCIILQNTSDSIVPFDIKAGDRIAQGIISPIIQADFEEVEDLTETDRGEGGFGSTGE